MMDGLIPYLWRLITELSQATEAADLFDLKSNDPKSVAEFERLNKLCDEALGRLLDYVVKHHAAIRKAKGL